MPTDEQNTTWSVKIWENQTPPIENRDLIVCKEIEENGRKIMDCVLPNILSVPTNLNYWKKMESPRRISFKMLFCTGNT